MVRAGTLTFPSALDTPHRENNIVCGRLFAASDKQRAVVVMPQWNSDAGGHIGLIAAVREASASPRCD